MAWVVVVVAAAALVALVVTRRRSASSAEPALTAFVRATTELERMAADPATPAGDLADIFTEAERRRRSALMAMALGDRRRVDAIRHFRAIERRRADAGRAALDRLASAGIGADEVMPDEPDAFRLWIASQREQAVDPDAVVDRLEAAAEAHNEDEGTA